MKRPIAFHTDEDLIRAPFGNAVRVGQMLNRSEGWIRDHHPADRLV